MNRRSVEVPVLLVGTLFAFAALGGCITEVSRETAVVEPAGPPADPATAEPQQHDHGDHTHTDAPGNPGDAPEAAEPGDESAMRSWDMANPPDLSHTPPFPLEKGRIPSLEEAQSFPKRFSSLSLSGNDALRKLRAEGAMTGAGTPEDPYVLDRFYVSGSLSIASANQSLILRNGYVANQLRLNYVGESLYVHHIFAKDLRVNENVQREGANTGGLFHDNKFAFVGQIRHFVGEFRDNLVGPRPPNAMHEALGDQGIVLVSPSVVFNFDGFHTADVHHNTFLGQVDIKLHGHNHADCFTCPVHDHHDKAEFPATKDTSTEMRSRHSVRYVSLLFRDNTIVVPDGIALRYNDRNHAGDDRTASSEPNPYLNDPHVHYQDITIRGNRLDGGYLLVDVFNAADTRQHRQQNRGVLRIWDNTVDVEFQPATMLNHAPTVVSGILLRTADGIGLDAKGNAIDFREDSADSVGEEITRITASRPELRGLTLETLDASNVSIRENSVAQGRYGVYAFRFTETVHWRLVGNEFQTEEAWRGKDVENPPEESP